MIILARHGETPSIAAQKADSPESRIQGVGEEMPLSELGETQAYALGYAIGKFVTSKRVEVMAVQTSDVLRATRTRNNLLAAAGLDPPPVLQPPDKRLRGMNKGNLEGMLRSVAYPTKEIRDQQATDWHFRHGTLESGGETAYESGQRWLEWFNDVARPFEDSDGADSNQAQLVVGHNFITAFGIWLLTQPHKATADSLPILTTVTQAYKIDNGTALVLGRDDDTWAVSDRIVPSEQDFAKAGSMAVA